MPEEANQAPDQVQDTPTPETPAEQDTSQVVDYQQRYNNLRPEFDQKSQQLAEYEAILNDPEKYAGYLQEQGIDFAQEDDDTLDYEPVDPYLEHIQRLEAEVGKLTEHQKQQEVKAHQEQEYSLIDNRLEALEQKADRKLSEKAANWIGTFALNNRDEHGQPDVDQAFSEWQEMIEAERAEWLPSKKTKGRPGTGAAAQETIDKSTRKGRVDYMKQRFAEEDA